MARFLSNLQSTRSALLLALLASVFAISVHSQSTKPNSAPAEPNPKDESKLGSKQPSADPAAESSPSASAEQPTQAQIDADTKKLFQLAAELRTEVAKTYKDSLSLNVIKKAEAVEKLAKNLKTQMSKEAAASKR